MGIEIGSLGFVVGGSILALIAMMVSVFVRKEVDKSNGNGIDKTIDSPFDLMEAIPDALLITTRDGKIIAANKKCCDLFGYTAKELSKMEVEDLLPRRFRKLHKHQRQQFHTNPASRPMGMGRDLCILHKDGREIDTEIALGFSRFDDDNEIRAIVLLYDITSRKKTEKKMHYLAYHDVLTSLPNRMKFYDHAEHAIQRAKDNDWQTAFLIVDIDDFKRVNDTQGFHVGDEILKKVSKKLKYMVADHCAEEIDCCCFTARLGGDEFVILLERIKDNDDVHEAARHLFEIFKDPIDILGDKIKINISLGISMLPQHGISTSSLLKAADLALIAAKRAGKNQYFIHDKSMASKLEEFLRYERIIESFIEHKDFELHYQPIVGMKNCIPIGAEALFRGNVKKYGKLDYEFLIKVAEETNHIIQLGEVIFRRACEQCYQCEMLGPNRVVSVNASISQIEDPGFVDMCIGHMEEVGVKPHNMAIEITETMLMKKHSNIVSKLNALKEYGVKVYIDDFGKDYSSMTHLKFLPADKVKIDKIFIYGMENDKRGADLVAGIINLSHTLGLEVCAEGVENNYQLDLLQNFNIDQVQGYAIAKPMSLEDFRNFYAGKL